MALVVTLVAGVAIGALVVRANTAQAVVADVGVTTSQPRVGPMAGTRAPAVAVDPMENYARIVAGLSAAESRHDFAAKARFENQLESALTAETIGLIYQRHEQLMAARAESGRDSHAALITRELAKLCGPAAVKAQLDFCN
jgi:hypothetical protein